VRRAEDLVKFWGWNTQGDFGPWTFFTDKRRGLVWFLKAPPLEPPSQWQSSIRNKIRITGYTWRAIGPKAKADWQRAAKRAHLKITGYNLFTYYITTGDAAAIATIQRLAKIQLIPLIYEAP